MSDSTITAASISRNLTEATHFHRDYQLTCLINTLAGNAANQGWEAARHQLPIMEEEWNELKRGIEKGNAAEVRDGAADLLFTLIGFAHRTGIDLLADFAEVVKSNFTKVDHSSHHAMLTRVKYLKLGVNTVNRIVDMSGRTYWVTLTEGEQTDINAKHYPAGKWLKSVNFEDVNFRDLPEGCRLNEPVDSLEVTPVAADPGDTQGEATSIELPRVAVNDAYLDAPVESVAADSAPSANLPCIRAVNDFLLTLRTDPAVCQGLEEFLSFTAYRELMAVSADGHAVSPAMNAAQASAAAITGAQRFLTWLLVPHAYKANLHPYRYATVRLDDARIQHHQRDHFLASVLADDRPRTTEELATIATSLVEDWGYLNTWYANFAMAWKDSAVPNATAERIARLVLMELFGLSEAVVSTVR